MEDNHNYKQHVYKGIQGHTRAYKGIQGHPVGTTQSHVEFELMLQSQGCAQLEIPVSILEDFGISSKLDAMVESNTKQVHFNKCPQSQS